MAQYLERRWWQRYLRNKSPEQYLEDKRAYWSRVLQQLDHEVKAGESALDAGCGPAGVFIHLQEQATVTAIDPLLEYYANDLAIFNKEDYPTVNFITAPLETADLSGEVFDTIYCFNAINHVADWNLALDQLTKMAKPGTRLLLSSDVHRHRLLQTIFRALPGDMLHPQQHLVEAYRKALTQRGWRIEKEKLLRQEAIFNYTAWSAVFIGTTN